MRKFLRSSTPLNLTAFWLATLVGFAALAGTNDQANDGSKNLMTTAASSGQYTTLTRALAAAGLSATLRGDGPYTVFAPTDQAFAALPDGVLEDLLRPENRDQLRAVLSRHVVAGQVLAADVAKMNHAASLQGVMLPVQTAGGSVHVGDATVIQPDMMASNGVIHGIDAVLLPLAEEPASEQ